MSHGPKLRRVAASEYLRSVHGIDRKPATLAKLATIGGGPLFSKFGRAVLYDPADLDAWVGELLSAPVRSTSELRG